MNNRWMVVAVVAVLVLFSALVLKNTVVSANGPVTLVASAPAPQDGDSVQPSKNGPPVPWKNGPPVPWKNGPPVPWKQ